MQHPPSECAVSGRLMGLVGLVVRLGGFDKSEVGIWVVVWMRIVGVVRMCCCLGVWCGGFNGS